MKSIKLNPQTISAIWPCKNDSKLELPLYLEKIRAGFPSPAEGYLDKRLDLNELVVKNPASTFYVKVEGDSMIGAGIACGDLLVVDKAKEAKNNSIIIAALNGELTVKRIKFESKDKIWLTAENENYQPISVTPETDFEVWGVVISVVRQF